MCLEKQAKPTDDASAADPDARGLLGRALHRAFVAYRDRRLVAPPRDTYAIAIEAGSLDGNGALDGEGRSDLIVDAPRLAKFPQQPVSIGNRLAEHPLFTDERIRELLLRVPREHIEIRSPPGHDRDSDGRGYGRPERIHDISGVHAFAQLGERPLWINVHHAQRFDPGYHAFLQSYLDQLGARFDEMRPEVYEAGCFLILSSGAATVHFHADPDQSFLNQIRGDKTVYTYPAAMLPETVIEELAFSGDHAAVSHRPEYERYGNPPIHLTPGRSVLLPLYAPHRVENGDAISVSLSVGFHTRQSLARSRAHLVHRELRALGLPLGIAGRWSSVDRIIAPMHLGVRARDAVARAVKRRSESAA